MIMAFIKVTLTDINFTKTVSNLKEKDTDTPWVLDTVLTTLTYGQRICLTAVVSILCFLSLLLNVATFFANQKRQIRLFYRSCLLSLALSDLITTTFLTLGYLAQFSQPFVQIWCLGAAMCRFIPFVTTGAILVSSMTLVGIALDRYFAVMKAVLSFWNPTGMFCVFCMLCIWALSFGIASPMLTGYSTYEVYIVSTSFARYGAAGYEKAKLVQMCVSGKDSNGIYYVLVLAFIFVPTLVAFLWLNSIIANKLWTRRHRVVSSAEPWPVPSIKRMSSADGTVSALSTDLRKQMETIQHPAYQCDQDNKTLAPTHIVAVPIAMSTVTSGQINDAKNLGRNSSKHTNGRESHHLRMFTVVLILMALFIFFRLPAWIFLIMRMYGSYTRPVHWLLHFYFGVLTLTSCVLNPLLYTFLANTIQYAVYIKDKLDNCNWNCLKFKRRPNSSNDNRKISHDVNRNRRNANIDGDNTHECNGIDPNGGVSNDGANSTSHTSTGDGSQLHVVILLDGKTVCEADNQA